MVQVAPNAIQEIQEIPIEIAGGTHYGRYPKISLEESWNFIVSDGWLVPYAGYKNVVPLIPTQPGRGIYASYVADIMIAVIAQTVYSITPNLTPTIVGQLTTFTGDVYIAENNGGIIAITDGANVYTWNYATTTFTTIPGGSTNFPFMNPGFISFQNQRFIVACNGSTVWALSGFNTAIWYNDAQHVGAYQFKADYIQAAVPVPGGGSNLLVFGRNGTELWQDIGAAIFPYQRSSTRTFDYGCINPSTISSLNQFVVWIAVNEQSGPVLMIAAGTDIKSISTDGIDYKLGNLKNPTNCTGFLYQQDGHLLYQFTFPDDNISYAYDFETQLFFNVSDENLNFHIARQIVYFNNTYYFVSLSGGNIYEFDTLFTDADYGDGNVFEIPRIRITKPLRLPSQRYFVIKSLGFTIEQGQPNIVTTVPIEEPGTGSFTPIETESLDIICTEDNEQICIEGTIGPNVIGYYTTTEAGVYLSISRDGGETFGSSYLKPMNATGQRKSRFIFQRLGHANDATFQLRFVGLHRFVVNNGLVELYE